jgi:WD40 repeat protein
MPRSNRLEFADQLNAARLSRKLSIREVAKIAGVPPATAQGWLNGRHFPVAALRPHYLKIVDELGLRNQIPADLWGDSWDSIQPSLRELRSPYLGLRPFGVADEALFHGRSAESARLAQAVLALRESFGHGVVVLVGPSGSGKSSLLAAGLVARECAAGVLAGWRGQIVAHGCETTPATGGQDLVVFDQFEDVLLEPTERRGEILKLVETLATDRIVVIGLRSDAFGLAALEPTLTECLSRPILLAPLSRAEIREVIVGPAGLSEVTVDEELVRALELDLASGPSDAAVETDVLPLLSNALLVTWAAGSGKRMSLADYQAAGGVSSAVESLAEDVYFSLTPDQQQAAESLFLRLVRISGENVVREPLPLDSVGDLAHPAMEAFVAARMLTLSDGKVQISHDALVAHWSRLRDWVEQSREDLEVLASVRRASQVWVDSEREDGALIPIGRLAYFASWLADSTSQRLLSSTEREFLAASEAHFASVLSAEQQTSSRLRRRGRIALSLAATATALAVIAGTFYAQAQTSRAEAQSRQIATSSRSIRSKDRNLSTQMAAVSVALAPTQEAVSAAVDATSIDAPLRWSGEPSGVMTASSETGFVARAGGTGRVTLWRDDALTTTPGTDFEVDSSKSALWAIALKKVGSRTLMAVGGKSVRALWDVTDQPRQLADLRGDDGTTYGAAFTADGTQLLFGTQFGEVTVWDLNNPEAPRQQTSLKLDVVTNQSGTSAVPPVSALAIGPTGVVYVGGEAGWISRWQLRGDQPIRLANLSTTYIPTGGTAPASVRALAIAVSPDGTRLAAGQAGRAMLTWTLGSVDSAPTVVRGFASYVNAVSYSPDSSQLIVGSSDQNVTIYAANTGSELRRLPNSAIITGVGLSLGRPVAVGTDGTLRVWPTQSPMLRPAGGTASYNLATDGSSNGWLAVGNSYTPTGLWRLSGGTRVKLPDPQVSLPAGDAQYGAVAVAPDGSYLVGGSGQGRVICWPLGETGAGQATMVETGLEYIATVKVSPDGKLIAAVEDEGKKVALLKADGAGGAVLAGIIVSATPISVAFNADSTALAVGLTDRVELWSVVDPSNPTLVSTIAQSGTDGTKLATSRTSPLLAIGDGAGVVALWNISDPTKPNQVRAFTDAAAEIYSVDFSPDGNQLVATSGDDLVWGWDLASSSDQAIFVLDGGFARPWDARFINNGEQLAVSGNTGEIRVWTAKPQAAKAQLCANRGAALTAEEWQRYLPGVSQMDPC